MTSVKDQKDFWSGLLFIAFGAAGLWFGRDYAIGSASAMGPGYFPWLISGALILFGAIIFARSLVVAGEPIERIAFWPQLLILASIVVFGLLIERIGLAASVVVVALISGLAGRGLRWFELLALALTMSAFCVVLFVYLLGQPIPVWVR